MPARGRAERAGFGAPTQAHHTARLDYRFLTSSPEFGDSVVLEMVLDDVQIKHDCYRLPGTAYAKRFGLVRDAGSLLRDLLLRDSPKTSSRVCCVPAGRRHSPSRGIYMAFQVYD